MRLSISAKIFIGFLSVLAIFAATTAYTVFAMRRLGDELRLVSSGYLELRLTVAELQNSHSNLLKVLGDQVGRGGETHRLPPYLKFAVDDARRIRQRQQLPLAYDQLRSLGERRLSSDERLLLTGLRERLDRIAAAFRESEVLFDEVFGPIGEATPTGTADTKETAEKLVHRERTTKRELASLAMDLRVRAQQTSLRLEDEESRAIWWALGLGIVALMVGLGVAALAGRTLLPLRRLAERTKEIARGDYQKRVPSGGHDEIAALAREFNQMAAALDEREQQLIRSERLAAIGKLAAQITHEVRNPLSSIGLNAEQLDEELSSLPGTGEARTLARAIVKEVDRLTEITEAYLRFARMPRPRLEREELRSVLGSLLDFQRPELEKKNVSLVVEMPPEDCPLLCDEQQLRQALLNLIRNAGEAMPTGGELAVRLGIDAAGYALDIADSGAGIEPDHLQRVFEPFFSTKQGGTGLGLALTQQIVLEHGGTIHVRSEPGHGTTFTVQIPASLEEPRQAA